MKASSSRLFRKDSWVEGCRSTYGEVFNCVIPAWSAGIQPDMDVSGCILANLGSGDPCRHDEQSASSCPGGPKVMKHFVVILLSGSSACPQRLARSGATGTVALILFWRHEAVPQGVLGDCPRLEKL
jgi:hypothetical protein